MRTCVSFILAAALVCAADDAPFKKGKGWKPLLNGKDLGGWTAQDSKPNAWFTTTQVAAKEKQLVAAPGPGGVIVNGPGKTANIFTDIKHGDVELFVEFMVPQGSNSGVYLQGLYEVQVYDSYGVAAPKTSDCGAIYHRWIDNKPVGGSVPKVNASRKPGEWQSFHIWFRAPRFDASGKKVENARFLRVLHNGQEVQKDVEVDGPTRAHMNIPEAALNPLMLQGDHGPVAYRNLYLRPLRP